MLFEKTGLMAKGVLAFGAVLAAAGCGGPSRTERAMAEKDANIRRLETERAEAQEREGKLHEQNQMIAKQNEKMAEQTQFMAQQNAKLQVEASQKMDNMSMQLADLQKRLNDQKVENTQVVISNKEPGAITIRVANTVLFDSGHAELKAGANSTLEKVSSTLKSQYPDHFIRVEGHTDSTPVVRNKDKFKDNMELSQARSKAVYDFLCTKGGMPHNRMYTAGYGDSQKVVNPEKTAADRASNRRVDIVILPNVKVEKTRLAAK
jgi:chemotaxis protein MotB